MRSERPRCIRVSHGAGPWARAAAAAPRPRKEASAWATAAPRPTFSHGSERVGEGRKSGQLDAVRSLRSPDKREEGSVLMCQRCVQ